jgi:hypothetical protein
MSPVWLLLAAGVVSWAMRVLFIAVIPADRLPDRARRALTDATPAVLTALTVVLVIGGLRGAGEATIGGVVRRMTVSPTRGSPVHDVRKNSPKAVAAIRRAVERTGSFMILRAAGSRPRGPARGDRRIPLRATGLRSRPR